MYNQRKSRAQIDSEVSVLMSEYWSTFATYGDPNGQPFPHSNAFTADGKSKQEKNGSELKSTHGGNRRFSNGYVEGTRVDSHPWWPSLLGELPKPPVPEIHHSGSSSGGSSAGVDDQDKIQTDKTDRADPANVAPIDLTVDPVQSIISDSDSAKGSYSFDSTAPIIRSALSSGDNNHNNKWVTATINPDKDNPVPEDKTNNNKPKGNQNVPKGDSPSDSTTTKRTSAFDILIELSTNKNQLHKYSSLNRVQFMHQMVFDEESSVNIIENDCICNQWNELGYRL